LESHKLQTGAVLSAAIYNSVILVTFTRAKPWDVPFNAMGGGHEGIFRAGAGPGDRRWRRDYSSCSRPFADSGAGR
jgi:hypothetical protein